MSNKENEVPVDPPRAEPTVRGKKREPPVKKYLDGVL